MSATLTRRPNRLRTTLPSIFASDPFGSLREEFDQMLTNWFTTSDNAATVPAFAPMLDLNETDSNYEVKVDLPGIKAEDLKVHVAENVLMISGERKCEQSEGKRNGGTPHCVERFYGTFSRSIVLPAAVRQDKIDARYRDGVLTITLPKAEQTKPCEIAVKT